MYQNPYYCINQKVVVLDLDNTIIGDCKMLAEYDILVANAPWKLNKKPNEKHKKQLVEYLNQGLLRPGFKEFIQYIRQGKGYLIVVYTASLHKWANKILMAINEILGYKFYCLQLTSMDCLPPFFDKSLMNFQNELLKMGIDRRPDDFIMIDNNPVMTDKRLIIAPSYNLAPIKALQSMIDTKNITSNECRLHILQFDIQYFQEAPFRDNKNAVKDCYFMSLITTDFL